MRATNSTLTIGALAGRSGVHLETIRYYENRGLIPKPARSASGYRQYPSATVDRVRFIKRAQELGFTLAEIHELLAMRARPSGPNSRVRRLALEKLAVIDSKIRDLNRMREALQTLTAACDGQGIVAECPIIGAMEEDQP
jgi:Hg(II)-responsive transcriptional regulator